MYLRQFHSTLGFSWPIFSIYQILGLLSIRMALKQHLWYIYLVLATMERSGELIIGFVMANLPYIQNFRSLELPHGLAEAPVVHQLDPDHLGGVIFIIFL